MHKGTPNLGWFWGTPVCVTRYLYTRYMNGHIVAMFGRQAHRGTRARLTTYDTRVRTKLKDVLRQATMHRAAPAFCTLGAE